MLHDQLASLGAGPEQVSHHDTEIDALNDALAWAQPGDLIIMLSLAEQDEVLALVQKLGSG